jgi:calcium-dependent protein kinase
VFVSISEHDQLIFTKIYLKCL